MSANQDRELRVATEFSRTPGPRAEEEGKFSGEVFRRKILAPRLREAIKGRYALSVVLDGTAGYGTSFLEEAFGGLIRESEMRVDDLRRALRIVSTEEPYLIEDIWGYVEAAERSLRGQKA